MGAIVIYVKDADIPDESILETVSTYAVASDFDTDEPLPGAFGLQDYNPPDSPLTYKRPTFLINCTFSHLTFINFIDSGKVRIRVSNYNAKGENVGYFEIDNFDWVGEVGILFEFYPSGYGKVRNRQNMC